MDPKTKALYMGWAPEGEFKKFILWDMFGEEMLMYILGLGAPNNALPKESWHSFRRPVKIYGNYKYLYCESESMFTYQYSHAFVDFRNKHDKYVDYWKNSKNAIESSISFTKKHQDKHKTYKEGFWGISASDGPDGYKNYGATIFTHDGTVAPYAICGSVPYVPELSIKTLRNLLSKYGYRIWDDNYAFVSSFNLDKNWFSTEHVGIDLGISILMIENYRTGFIWKYFMKNKNIQMGMKKAGFKPGTKEDVEGTEVGVATEIVQKKYYAKKVSNKDKKSDGNTAKFDLNQDIEYGEIKNNNDLNAEFKFTWDDDNLYFNIDVTDNVIHAKRIKNELYKDDCVELYFSSPDTDVLVWGDKENFQIGLAPFSLQRKPVKYSFFQNEDPKGNIKLDVKEKKDGYIIKASIKWKYLNIKPQENKYLGFSVAVHDVDQTGDSGKKINWYFKNSPSGIKLGRLILE